MAGTNRNGVNEKITTLSDYLFKTRSRFIKIAGSGLKNCQIARSNVK